MATREIIVSDITGDPLENGDRCQVIIHTHPAYRANGFPVTLDCAPAELEQVVALEVVQAERVDPDGQRQVLVLSVDSFDQLIAPDRFQETIAQQRRARKATEVAADRPAPASRPKINYASLEHAGEPHRGRITDAERQVVRDHLAAVNERLAGDGLRTIDPGTDVAARYGL